MPVDGLVDGDLGAAGPSRVPARSQRTVLPLTVPWLTIRGGSNLESITLTPSVPPVGSRSTVIPSGTGEPRTFAMR